MGNQQRTEKAGIYVLGVFICINVKEQLCERRKYYCYHFTRGEKKACCLSGWWSFRRTVTEQVAKCFNLFCKLESFCNYSK